MRNPKERIRQTEEWLDESYIITNTKISTLADESYYKGAIHAIESLGFKWTRDENGKHKLY